MSVPRLTIDETSEWLDIGLDAGGDGGTLFATEEGASSYQTEIGGLEVDRERIALPDVDGEFVGRHGIRGRTIVWSGNLRLSDAAIVDVYKQRDAFIIADQVMTFIDWTDIEYPNCELVAYQIVNRRPIMAVGEIVWLAEYRIELRQLALANPED